MNHLSAYGDDGMFFDENVADARAGATVAIDDLQLGRGPDGRARRGAASETGGNAKKRVSARKVAQATAGGPT